MADNTKVRVDPETKEALRALMQPQDGIGTFDAVIRELIDLRAASLSRSHVGSYSARPIDLLRDIHDRLGDIEFTLSKWD